MRDCLLLSRQKKYGDLASPVDPLDGLARHNVFDVMDTDPVEPRQLLHTRLAEVYLDTIFENLEFFDNY